MSLKLQLLRNQKDLDPESFLEVTIENVVDMLCLEDTSISDDACQIFFEYNR